MGWKRGSAGAGRSKRASSSSSHQRSPDGDNTACGAGPSGEDKKEKLLVTRKKALVLVTCLAVVSALVILAGVRNDVPSMSMLGWARASTATLGQAGMEVEECDMSKGKWVRESRGAIYTNTTCSTVPDNVNCQKFGKDPGHLHWRWQPDGCELPRFSPEKFLDVVRGKRLAFIGDSLARNHMDSLLCLLSQAETPTDMHASESDVDDIPRKWHFPSHDFTLMAVWTGFFVHAVPVVAGERISGPFSVHLDRIDTSWTRRLPELDYAVVSGGNWLFRANYLWERGRVVGCVHCREANLTHFSMSYAVRRVVRAAVEAIVRCDGCKKGGGGGGLAAFLRTYTPDHFEHGSWFTGGYCNRTQPLEEDEVGAEAIAWELRRVQVEEVRRARETTTTPASGGRRRIGVLDVTNAMMLRADGHPGRHHGNVRVRNDCLHLCLPGPIDMWNDVLLRRLVEVSPPSAAR